MDWRKWRYPAALVVYAVLVLWVTWPLAINASSALAGSSTDALLHYWNSWFVLKALGSGQTPLSTNYLFYPEGASLVYHNMAWLSIIPWLALQTILDGILAYNLIFLANLILVAYAAFLLALQLTENTIAALIAGLIYLAWPYRISQLDHPNLISTYWIPLFFLLLLVAIRNGRWQYGLLAGLALALIGFTRWQLLIPAFILLSIFLLFSSPQWIRDRQRQIVILVSLLTAVLLLSPAAGLFLSQQSGEDDSLDTLLRDEESMMQSDLLAYITPAESNPLFGESAATAYDRYYADRSPSRRFPIYIGIVTLILAIIGLWRRPRSSLPWLAMTLVIVLLALGPIFRFNGRLLSEIPTPYGILEPLYILRLMRVPERFNIELALPMAIMAAFGVSVLLAKLPGKGKGSSRLWSTMLMVLLVVLILADYGRHPVTLQSAESNSYFEKLASEVGQTAVINLPIDAVQSKVHMFDQTIHELPLLQGHISRPTVSAYEFIDANPFLRSVRIFDEMPPWLKDVSHQLAALEEQGFGSILIYKNQIGLDRIERIRRYLAFSPLYEDDEIIVYRTDPAAGRDFNLEAELAPGIGPVDSYFTASCAQPGQPMELGVAWGITSGQTAPYQARLALINPDGHEVQNLSYPIGSSSSVSRFSANELFWAYYPFQIASNLEPGQYDLSLALNKANESQLDTKTISLGSLIVSYEPCPHELPNLTNGSDVLFGNVMRLLAYELERSSEDLVNITLYWRGEQSMDKDYKIFVHIFEPGTGIPVAQDDAMPHRGGLPTRLWAPGDRVTDSIPIDISQVEAGEYGLAIGVYDPATGDRLPLEIFGADAPEDGRFVTGDLIIVESG